MLTDLVHSQSIIHRDIKPDNLLVSQDDVLKVVDFGVSEMFEKPDGMKVKKSAGSPAFLAPELCSPHGEVSGTAADIWSMGVCLYCFRYGKIPFNRPTVLDMYEAIQTEKPHIPDDEDPVFASVLNRLLEKDPEKRITVEELRVSTEHPSETGHSLTRHRTTRGSPRTAPTRCCPKGKIARTRSSRPTS